MSTIDLANGSASVTVSPDHLLVVEHAAVDDAAARLYLDEVGELAGRHSLRQLLVVVRVPTYLGDEKSATWQWLHTQRAFDKVAFVVDGDMAATHVNMMALAERLVVRAFRSTAEAVLWLARQRRSSTSLESMTASTPPPVGDPTPPSDDDTVRGKRLPR